MQTAQHGNVQKAPTERPVYGADDRKLFGDHGGARPTQASLLRKLFHITAEDIHLSYASAQVLDCFQLKFTPFIEKGNLCAPCTESYKSRFPSTESRPCIRQHIIIRVSKPIQQSPRCKAQWTLFIRKPLWAFSVWL